jgi:hypothetical protein
MRRGIGTISLVVYLGCIAFALPASDEREEARAKLTPWSPPSAVGWEPVGVSAMTKYDQATNARAAAWEARRRRGLLAGDERRDGWAAAAVTEPEPTRVARYRGVRFRVGEIKALLAAAHAADPVVTFGQPYTGPGSDPEDLSPDRLWRLCRGQIRDRGRALVMDLDNGREVRAYPVHAYRVDYEPVADQPDTYDCRMVLYGASTNVPPDYVGAVVHRRTYQFQVRMKDGTIEDGSGRWSGANRWNHPDFAWYPVERRQENPQLDYEAIRAIAAEAGAFAPR